MDQLRRITAVAALIALAGAASACAPTPTPTSDTSPKPSAAQPSNTPGTTTGPTEFAAKYVESEPLLGKLDSVRGTAEVGPFTSSTGRVFVYIRCFGESDLSVEIVGAASFDQKCLADADDPGTLNSFDVSYVDEVIVRGSADNSNLWALAVTEAPA